MKTKRLLLALYIAGAIATFGHAWNRDFSRCSSPEEAQLFAATASAAVWPLYWSAWFWKGSV